MPWPGQERPADCGLSPEWRCLGRSKEHFVWTVRPITQLPLPWAAKVRVREMGLWDGWNLVLELMNIHVPLESFYSSAERLVFLDMWYMCI